jgi:hypothetical protein
VPQSSLAAGRCLPWQPSPYPRFLTHLASPGLCGGRVGGRLLFNGYLAHGAGILTIGKGLGALAVAAWGLDWAVNQRPVLTTRQLWLIAAFLPWTTEPFHPDLGAGWREG